MTDVIFLFSCVNVFLWIIENCCHLCVQCSTLKFYHKVNMFKKLCFSVLSCVCLLCLKKLHMSIYSCLNLASLYNKFTHFLFVKYHSSFVKLINKFWFYIPLCNLHVLYSAINLWIQAVTAFIAENTYWINLLIQINISVFYECMFLLF